MLAQLCRKDKAAPLIGAFPAGAAMPILSDMSQVPEAAPVALSDRAARRIAKILEKEPAGSMLRVAVNGGGCSGFQYEFAITGARNADDLGIEKNGVTVLIDEVSVQYLAGSEIDYADELIGAAFKIKNPNATASCGCGTSFSV
jgi:iron-sulfur cluster assembly accessory protein